MKETIKTIWEIIKIPISIFFAFFVAIGVIFILAYIFSLIFPNMNFWF